MQRYSTDRTSVAPLRVRNDDNAQPKRSRSLTRQSTSCVNPRSSTTGRSQSGSRRSAIPSTSKQPRLSSATTPRKSSIGVSMRGNGVPKDPRPISDRSFQQRCIKKVLQFLTTNGYPSLTSKSLQSPTAKDFYKIFEFIVSYLIPKYKVPQKPEDDIPKTLKLLGYPFLISKTSMFAVGSPHTWPHLLAALVYLVDLVTYQSNAEQSVETILYVSDDFESKSEQEICSQYNERCYLAYMEGSDDFDEETDEFQSQLRQRYLGVGSMDETDIDAAALEEQVALLEQEGDRLKNYRQKLQQNELDEEKYLVYLKDVDAHKRQQETSLADVEAEIAVLETEKGEKVIALRKMKEIEEQQEFSQEDVERIHMKGRELRREREDLDKALQAVNSDIWKEEIALSKELEKSNEKKLSYNKLAENLKLMPVSAENAGGVNYEIRKTDFQNTVKPALMTLKAQCLESANKAASEKIALLSQLEQVNEDKSDLQTQLNLLDSKYKRANDEVECKKQLHQKELETLHERSEEIKNDIQQLQSMGTFTFQDFNHQKTKLDHWASQKKEKADRKLKEYKQMFQEVVQLSMEHMETMQAKLKQEEDSSKRILASVRQEAEAKGIDVQAVLEAEVAGTGLKVEDL